MANEQRAAHGADRSGDEHRDDDRQQRDGELSGASTAVRQLANPRRVRVA